MAVGRPFTSDQSRKEAAENGRKGGIASGEAKRAKKELKECFEALLSSDVKDKKTGKMLSGAEAIAASVFQAALKGDLRAFEIIRDTAGQKPVERVVTAAVDPAVIDEVERMVHDKTRGD